MEAYAKVVREEQRCAKRLVSSCYPLCAMCLYITLASSVEPIGNDLHNKMGTLSISTLRTSQLGTMTRSFEVPCIPPPDRSLMVFHREYGRVQFAYTCLQYTVKYSKKYPFGTLDALIVEI